MVDDIDIEEHDVRMDPQGPNSDCDDNSSESDADNSKTTNDGPDSSQESEFESTDEEFTVEGESDDDLKEYRNVYPGTKIILGTKPSSRPGAVILGSKLPSQECSSETDSQESEQVGIQSSKPERVLEDAVVRLEDLFDFLSKSPKYCDLCETLFPNRNALDVHNMAVHSLLVAIEGNDRVEEPEPIEEAREDCEVDFEDRDTVILDRLEFSSVETEIENEVDEEMEEEETVSEMQTKDETENTSNNTKDAIATNEVQSRTKDNTMVYYCPICSFIYRNKTFLEAHVANNHHAEIDAYFPKPFQGGCKICHENTTLQNHNNHVKHHDEFRKEVEVTIDSGTTSAVSKQIGKRKMLVSERKTGKLYTFQCTECDKKFLRNSSAWAHNKSYHPGKRTTLYIGPKNKRYKQPQPQYMTMTPKNIVFKCENCPLHFLTGMGVIGHNAKPCGPNIKSFTCGVCKKLFRKVDQKLHRLQHKGNGKIRFYIFHKNTYERVLFKCWKCEVHFEEKSFFEHRNNGCDSNKPKKLCDICNIHVNKIGVHQEKHDKKKMLKTDFILIDEFITPTSQIGSNNKLECSKSDKRKGKMALVVEHKPKKTKVDKPMQCESLKILYRCETCDLSANSYDYVIDHCQQHINSANYKVPMSKCKNCSLNFEGDCLNDLTEIAKVKILSYKYDNLLKPDWLKIFDTIPKKIVDQITSRSKYVSRAVKMNVILDGPPELTMYKCGTCKNYVDTATVYNHTHYCDGSTSSFACKFCGIKFSTAHGVEIHEMIHEKSDVTANSYRIVSFNAKLDKEFNKKLKLFECSANELESGRIRSETAAIAADSSTVKTKSSATRPDSNTITSESKSGAIRWSYSSIKTYSRVKKSKSLILPETTTNEPVSTANDLGSFEIPNKSGNSLKMYFFQCNKCKICFPELKLIDAHHCGPENSDFRRCDQCGYITHSKSMIHHYEWHRKNKSITKEDIIFLAFEDSKIIFQKRLFERFNVYYQCLDCKILLSSKQHDCGKESTAGICMKCKYTFLIGTLNYHMEKHLEDESITRDSMFVIPFTKDAEDTISKFNEGSDDACNEHRPVKDEMYQCIDCKCIFGSKSDFTAHHRRKCCHVKNGVKCNICSLLFHLNVIDFHKEKHKTSMTAGEDVHTLVPLSKSDMKSYTLYKCSKCLIHFALFIKFRLHLNRRHNSGVCQNCEVCNLKFPQSDLSNHIKNHHEMLNLKTEDFNVVSPRLTKDGKNGEEANQTKNKKPYSKLVFEADETDDIAIPKRSKVTEISTHSHAYTEAAKNSEIPETVNINDGVKLNTGSVNKNNSGVTERVHVENDALTTNAALEITNVNIPGEDVEYDNVLYQCKCGINFMKASCLKTHIQSHRIGHTVQNSCRCSQCDFLFTSTSLAKHIQVHHQVMNLTKGDIVVKTAEKWKPKVSFKYKRGPKTKFTAENTLYVCTKCDLCCIKKTSLYYHMIHGHGSNIKTAICKVCGLKFSRICLTKHVSLHHAKNKFSAKDFHIYEATLNMKDKSKDAVSGSALSFGKSVEDVNSVSHSSGVMVARSDSTKLIIKRISVSSANESSKEKGERQTKEPKCTDPKIIDTVNLDSPVPSPVVPETNANVTHKSDTKDLGVTSQTKMLTEKSEIIKIADEYSVSNDRATVNKTERSKKGVAAIRKESSFNKCAESNASSSHEESIENSKITLLKLYKCGACNVHFLKRKSVQKHIADHVPFDAMEYMECKLCNLQFKIAEIEKHVKKNHKNKDFDLAKTLIEEYQLCSDNDSPKSAIYYAVDRMQSALVSTSADDDTISEENVVSSSVQKYSTAKENTRKPSTDSLTVAEKRNLNNKNDGLDKLEAQKSMFERNVMVEVPIEITNAIKPEYDVSPSNSSDKKHYCNLCNETFPSNRAKEFHDNLEHFDPMKQCPLCNKSMNESILNEMHLNIHNGRFHCCLCGSIVSVLDIGKHSLFHSDRRQ